ncbi:hypothetical protein SDC9_181497 [bioreactor metagenome]|uniref:Uncharacterized protein n=1 Tax=bioreactor metagenome TaxID=1076179 RepID=A0A645H4T5_9ZZZZ
MLSGMVPHIYHLRCLLDCTECSFTHALGLTHKCYDSSVSGSTRVYIQKFDTLYSFNDIGYLFDNRQIPPLAKVRDTFDNLFVHYIFVYLFISSTPRGNMAFNFGTSNSK